MTDIRTTIRTRVLGGVGVEPHHVFRVLYEIVSRLWIETGKGTMTAKTDLLVEDNFRTFHNVVGRDIGVGLGRQCITLTSPVNQVVGL